MEPQMIVNATKIKLLSNYAYYDIFPVKRYHQCNIFIPQTIIIQNGFIKDWLFNSTRITSHPLLKKKKQNITILALCKTFIGKVGIHLHSATFEQLYQGFKSAKKQQKQHTKKFIQVTKADNQSIQMSISEFLDEIAEHQREQKLPEGWKMIQEKVVFQKIQEYYMVYNTRDNHKIQSKCQKIIKVESPKKQKYLSPEKSPISQKSQESPQKTQENYKFFDALLNKKFFQISQDLIEFIEKNFKCLVESVNTKFMLNRQRQPYLVGIYDLLIKPHKDIAKIREFQLRKNQGQIFIQQYLKHLEYYISHIPEVQTQKKQIKTKQSCPGRFCHIKIAQVLPAPENKYKIPKGPRIIATEMRDATVKNQLYVLQSLKEKKIIEFQENKSDDISEYSSENEIRFDPEERDIQLKPSQLKICQSCYRFYFYVGRYYEVNADYDLIQKKRVGNPKSPQINESDQTEKKANTQHLFEVKQINESQRYGKTTINKNKSNQKYLSPLQKKEPKKLIEQYKSEKKLPPTQSKIKLQPISSLKKIQNEQTVNSLNLPQSQRISLKQRLKAPKKQLVPIAQRRPQNYLQGAEQLVKKLANFSNRNKDEFTYFVRKFYKDNIPQPIDRRGFSSYYHPHFYEFMSNSPIVIHPKRRIKKRPEMKLKRLSQLTDYPQIVSRSQFIFDTLIITEEVTIPFCILSTKVVSPENIKSDMNYENIFIINDLFDSFIEHIALAKELLEEQNCFNKRIILFNYPGQSHTIYNPDHIDGISGNFAYVMDKLLYRLSGCRNQLKIINLKKDSFKFCGFGYGGYLLTFYLGSYHYYFQKITGVFLLNAFSQMPSTYELMLRNLLLLYKSDDPTAKSQAFYFYNKAIASSELQKQQLQHKSGLNPIRLTDRVYLIKSALKQYEDSLTTPGSAFPYFFENLEHCPVTVAYGTKNIVIPSTKAFSFMKYRNNPQKDIPNRLFQELDGGHDMFADNYFDAFQMLVSFACK